MTNKFYPLLLLFWLFVIFLIYFHTTDSFNQDLGRHIKLGEIIWQTREVPKTNLFSYTNPDEPVFNSHWGSQVIFYLVHQAAGVNGLIIISALINAIAFGLIFALMVKRVGLSIPSIVFIPFLYIFLDRTWIRPEAFANLFFALTLVCLFSPRIRKILKWSFPAIALLWINLHISAVLGVFGMGIVLAQDLLGKIREVRESIIIGVAVLVTMLINPYGLNGALSAFTVLNKYGYSIVENQSWFFLKDFGMPLVSHIFFGFLVLIFSFFITLNMRRKFLIGELILLAVVIILTLRFVRNEIFFAYIAFIVACLNFGQLKKVIGKDLTAVSSLLIGLISIALINQSHESHGLPLGFGNQESYKSGVDFFLKNDIKRPILNNFDIGGYLIYRLWPETQVFVDNRPEAYPVNFFQEVYKRSQEGPKIFEEVVARYGIQTVIWGHRDITPWSKTFLSQISQNKAWFQAYLDEALVIYRKKR